jgi:hypothetical protein
MSHDYKFGPAAQTPEQRAWVLEQMLAAMPSLKTMENAQTRQAYDRYIAGELSWTEMRQTLKNIGQ